MAIINADDEDMRLKKIEFNKVKMQQIIQEYDKLFALAIKDGKVPEDKKIEMKISDNTLKIFGLSCLLRIEFSEDFDFDETDSHLVTIKPKNSFYDEIDIYKTEN